MKKKCRGLTLMELLIAIGLSTFSLLVLVSAYLFVYRHFNENIQRQNIYLQVSYALENMRVHCISATKIDDNSLLDAGITNSKSDFRFRGEQDFNTVTPDDPTDDAWYHYFIDRENNLVLSINDSPQREILVEKQYAPQIQFQYTRGAEPNFLMVTITAGTSNMKISETEGIRFWFVGITK